MQDNSWIDRLREGDSDAFRTLVDAYQARVMNLCNAYLHDLHEAEDIAQDVFIEVLESIHKFRGDSAIGTWIYRIAVNKAINRRKKLLRRAFFNVSGTQQPKIMAAMSNQRADGSQEPDYPIRQSEDRKALHQAIDRLPAQQRSAFVLHKYEELSYKEIAGVLGTSVSSVESLLFRAKGNLRKHLSDYIKNS